jgi:predicted MFS family arabinose efflux permease
MGDVSDHAERDVPRTGAARPAEHGSTAPTRPVPAGGRVRRTRPIPTGNGSAAGAAGAAGATGAARAAGDAGRRTAGAGRGAARLAATAARGTGRGGRAALRRLTHTKGASESGLSRVLELHLVSTAADTLILTALASTIFFAVPTEAARGRVAMSLLVTMVPFVVLAPLIGPLLDRVPHGRRYALAATMVVRAWLAWVMASAVAGGGEDAAFSLYPAALGFLVCQKAYLVTRAAGVPRVLPPGTGLVGANARISMSGVVAMVLAAPLGAGLTGWLGPTWTLRLAFLVYAGGTALALALSPRIDAAEADEDDQDEDPDAKASTRRRARRAKRRLGRRVVLALRANTALRAFTGFLTLFLAFRLRTAPVGGLNSGTAVALVIAVAGVGGGVGTALGGLLRRVRPTALIAASIAAVAVTGVWAAIGYGLWAVIAISAVAGLAQALGKLSLDALVQTEVPERTRTSAFARSETALQLAWVGGGAVGLVLPLSGPWGLGVAAVATATAGAVLLIAELRR